MTTVDFHFDPLCPFAYQTSVWIRDVRAQLGITINWRFFSLEEINLVAGKKHPWERDWSYGWSLMRIGALLRRTNMSLLDRWYAAIGHELHTLGGKPHDPAVARRLLCDVGVNAAILDAALDDPTTHDDVRATTNGLSPRADTACRRSFWTDNAFLGRCWWTRLLDRPP